jgi:acylphosphatase
MPPTARPEEERIRRHVIVSGRVQGVFFRDSTQREAQRRGAGGWVRNLGDGTVEAVFEGRPEVVEAMVDFCRRGPERARVDRLDVDAGQPPEGLSGFEIR